jgi:hypothetical protein
MSGGSNLKIVDRGVEYRSRSPTCTERIIHLINLQRPVRAAGRARCEVIHHIRTKRAIIPSDFRQALEDAQYTEGDYAVSYTFPSPSDLFILPLVCPVPSCRATFVLHSSTHAFISLHIRPDARLVARHATRLLPRTGIASCVL